MHPDTNAGNNGIVSPRHEEKDLSLLTHPIGNNSGILSEDTHYPLNNSGGLSDDTRYPMYESGMLPEERNPLKDAGQEAPKSILPLIRRAIKSLNRIFT